ncbi:MAG: T9SS type A sorting domain-containing protein [Rhodothermales bacterium]
MSRLLLLSLLLTPTALAQDGIVSSIETDRAEYAYGETIVVRYTLANQSDEPVTIESSGVGSDCTARLRFDPGIVPHVCVLDDIARIDFDPHSSVTFVWDVLPSEQGLPAVTGEQNVTGFFSNSDYSATTSFSAPQYLGGRLEVVLADGLTLSDVRDVMKALDAVVTDSVVIGSIGITYYYWQISGTTLEEARATYRSDPRFRRIFPLRGLHRPIRIYTVNAEDEATPSGSPVLTTAYPNPFTASTSFALTVPASGPARVEVFDLLGRRVAVLHDGPLAAGAEHHFTFHAASLPSGLYVVRATGEGFTETRRVTLAR